jgi:RNAse (barnase) inhibitor barstar
MGQNSMITKSTIDVSNVSTWDEFHQVFINEFEFPSYYGRNGNAWIDCMEDFAITGSRLELNIKGMDKLKEVGREMYDLINDCSAFINYRSVQAGGTHKISLCYGD